MKGGQAPVAASLAAPARVTLLPWRCWLVAAGFFCFGYFLRISPSVMVQDLMRDFGVSGAAVGTLSSFYFYPYALTQLPVGMVHDRFGPRRVLTVAVLVVGLSCALIASAPTFAQALIGRLFTGLGCSFAYLGTIKLVAIWFPSRRFALLTGLTVMIGMAGAVGGQMPLAVLVEGVGWRSALAGAAVLSLVIGTLVWTVVRDGPAGAAAAAGARAPGGSRRDVAFVLRNPQTWANGLVCAAVTTPLFAFGGLWGVPYMMAAHGLGRADAAAAMSLVLVGWGIGAPVLGGISDRMQRRKPPILAGAVVAFAALLSLIYVPGLPRAVVYILLFTYGFAGASSIICYAAGRECNPPQSAATSVGMVNMMPMLMGAAFQPLIGWLLDLRWVDGMVDGARIYSVAGYQFAFSSLIGCAVIGVGVGVFIRETRGRGL